MLYNIIPTAGADVRVRATNLIKFEKDVFIKSGAIMNANTKTANYGTVFRSEQKNSKLIKSSTPINILELSEFHLKKCNLVDFGSGEPTDSWVVVGMM